MGLPDATIVKAIAVRAGRAWILTPNTLMEHDRKRVVRETALCSADNKRGDRGTYWYLAADEHGALAVGADGSRMLVSRVDLEGQLHCRKVVGGYPVAEISADGVWLTRTGTGVELQDESGWRSTAVQLEPDVIVHGVARRRHALAHAGRTKGPWVVYEFDGASWSPTRLPRGFAYTWMSDQGVALALPAPRQVLQGGRDGEEPNCDAVLRIEGRTTTYIALPPEFHPRGIAGRSESDLWVTGSWTAFHWDGAVWREATPPIQTEGGVVDEDGAFWFVGARTATGLPHAALYRVRRK